MLCRTSTTQIIVIENDQLILFPTPSSFFAFPLDSLINYCKSTRDYLVPSVWGPVSKGEDPYAPAGGGCNCVAM